MAAGSNVTDFTRIKCFRCDEKDLKIQEATHNHQLADKYYRTHSDAWLQQIDGLTSTVSKKDEQIALLESKVQAETMRANNFAEKLQAEESRADGLVQAATAAQAETGPAKRSARRWRYACLLLIPATGCLTYFGPAILRLLG